ncbi:MAG: hypothetical protein JXL80_05685 [Planctomycetes bacterium]|nr:hypothetical protein [Planctomycetota bacterium]
MSDTPSEASRIADGNRIRREQLEFEQRYGMDRFEKAEQDREACRYDRDQSRLR